MTLAMIGLGRMGGNMARRLMRRGHTCVVFDREPSLVAQLADEGAVPVTSSSEVAVRLTAPRIVWLMVPAGPPTERAIQDVAPSLSEGDVIVDGGNSYFKDDVRRARELSERGIDYVDVGTSGGVWGFERGYCLMVGGSTRAFTLLEPLFRSLAPGRGEIATTPGREATAGTAEEGYLHCGPAGAGHFVKMVHNGIEYGLMQAYAEGFDLLSSAASDQRPSEERYPMNLADVAEVWRRGSVVGSWLLDLTARALAADPRLEQYSGHVADSGEGRWTIQTAIEMAVPVDVLATSLFARFRSRQSHTFADKVLSAMRHQFGGHVEPTKGEG